MLFGLPCVAAAHGRSKMIARLARTLLAVLAATLGLVIPAGQASAEPVGAAHSVTYDGYSFLIDGKRTYLWSGEFHYYRLPSVDLGRDVLQKMKAAGFNATSLYFDWGYQ